jgi:hypothetical protein
VKNNSKTGGTMNLDLVIEIAELAISIANNTLNGTQPAKQVTATLLQIVQNGALVYQQHTGQALDPRLIHTESHGVMPN